MKTLLVVGAGPLQVSAIKEAKSMGIRVVATDRDPCAPGMKLADVSYPVSTNDVSGTVEVAKKERVDGAIAICTDLPMMSVAAVNEALDLSGIRPEVARRATHKGEMRRAFEIAGAPIPQYRIVKTPAEARTAADEIGYPVIIKPPLSSGSRGVFKAYSEADTEKGFRHAKETAGDDSEILVEEFIDGPEVSVEALSFEGRHEIIAITDKRTTGDPYWVELGHVQPSRLPIEVLNKIREVTRSGLDALGIMNSPSHVEIKVGHDGPKLIEIGARLGGDFITTELTPRSTGVNMVRAAIQLALGQTPEIKIRVKSGVAIRYFIPNPGVVTSVKGLKEARKAPGVKIFDFHLEPGMLVKDVRSSLDRLGFVICEGQTADIAEERSLRTVGLVRIVTSRVRDESSC